MKKMFLLVAFATTMCISNAQTSIKDKTNQAIEQTLSKSNNFLDNTVNKTSNGIGTIYGDGKAVVGTLYGDSKEAVKYLTPKIEKAVSEIASGLKVGTKYVWNILVKQQRVWSWCYLIGFIVSIISWFHFYYRFKKGNDELDNAGEWKTSNIAMCWLSLGLSLTLSYFSFQYLVPMMTGFINPEFGAMQNVIEVAKSFK